MKKTSDEQNSIKDHKCTCCNCCELFPTTSSSARDNSRSYFIQGKDFTRFHNTHNIKFFLAEETHEDSIYKEEVQIEYVFEALLGDHGFFCFYRQPIHKCKTCGVDACSSIICGKTRVEAELIGTDIG